MEISRPYPQLLVRVVVHLLLAATLAQAANKFFIVDLDYELEHQFYQRIFDGVGDAPDQYRILPLLPLGLLCRVLPFNHAVLLYNAFCGFVVLELLWGLGRRLSPTWRWAVSFGLAILYIYTQYTGWRPDTMGLLLVSCLVAWVLSAPLRDRTVRWLLYGLGIVALSFSRTDIALVYVLFATFYRHGSYAAFIPVPILAQLLLQWVIFPEARYYTKPIMLLDNLRLHYVISHPATYLILAALVAFWRPISGFVRGTWRKNHYFYLLLAGYLVLVLVVGRVNEYRLYLPLLPLLLLFAHGTESKQGT